MPYSHFMLPCVFKTLTGLSCPWCGFQRGIFELLNGNIFDSIEIFPPLLPMMAMIGMLILRLLKSTANRLSGLYITFSLTVLMLLLNFMLKNFSL